MRGHRCNQRRRLLACSQPGLMFPLLSLFSPSFKVGTVCYEQPSAKWALIPAETSRCYCHTNKPCAGNSLPRSQPAGSKATPCVPSCYGTGRATQRNLGAPEQQRGLTPAKALGAETPVGEVLRRGCTNTSDVETRRSS